jgi:hypothetical protein
MDDTPRFGPSVEPPRARVRIGFVIALVGAVVLVIAVPLAKWRLENEAQPSTVDFVAHCTPLEVATYAPQLPDDRHAICLAVAGHVDDARSMLAAMPRDERVRTVTQLFAIAHPIADAGDDRSAGPIMALVVELWPDNYMAVFHAGMAEYALGHDARAKNYLQRFQAMYVQHDIWWTRARDALDGIAADLPLARRTAHFRE